MEDSRTSRAPRAPERQANPAKPRKAKKMAYMPALDGVRALAVLAVLGYHLNVPWAQGGLMGVTIFFVLSGFLITKLLLVEYTTTGRIDFAQFWIRRARRLLPAIVTVLLVMSALYTVFNHALLTKMRTDFLPSLFFFNNWWQIFHNVSYFDNLGAPSPLTHFWSLAIEEQYYLFFPIFLFVVMRLKTRRKVFMGILAGIALLSAVEMAVLYTPGGDPTRVYYGTDTRMFSLLIGACLAVGTIGRIPRVGLLGRQIIAAVSFAGLVAAIVLTDGMGVFPYYGGLVLVSLLTAALLYAVSYEGGGIAGKVLTFAPLKWLGERSYGVYLWHYPIILLMTDQNATAEPPVWMLVLQLAVTLVVAELSYRFVEQPLRRGRLLGPARIEAAPDVSAEGSDTEGARRVAGRVASVLRSGARGLSRLPLAVPVTCVLIAAMAVGGVGMAVVPSTSVLGAEAEQQIRDGAGVQAPDAAEGSESANTQGEATAQGEVSGQGEASAAPEATPSEGASDASSAKASEAPVAKDAYPIVVIGDSVASGVKNLFVATFPGGYMDAKPNRQIPAGIEAYKQVAATGKVGNKVVFALGTNAYLTKESLEEAVAAVGEDKHIWFVTVRKPGPSKFKSNEAIAAVAAEHKNVDVIDWYAASEGHDEYFNGDGTHLSMAGGKVFWQLIADATK